MGTVLFVSENTLERAENLRAAYDAYNAEKAFEQGWESYVDAPRLGYSAVVVDTMPPYMPEKGSCKVVFIGHGIPGGKTYAFEMPVKYLDERSRGQIDYAVCPSTHTCDILAGQLSIPVESVLPLGMPRTDALVGTKKGDGGTFLADRQRSYLYAPTFRDGYEEAPLPNIRWDLLDSMMGDDEVLVVKRHYYTSEPLVDGEFGHIVEVGNQEPAIPYLIDCDALLTDFSSISWDAFVAGKPAIFGTDGSEGYLKHRGMYYDYPHGYVDRWLELNGHEREMLGMLRAAADFGMCDRERELRDHASDMCDGRSSERVARLVEDVMNGVM